MNNKYLSDNSSFSTGISASIVLLAACVFLLLVSNSVSAIEILNSNFETGEYKSYGWGPSGNPPQIVTAANDPVCRENYSAKFALNYYDYEVVRYRTEATYNYNFEYGKEYWLSYAVLIPVGVSPRGGIQFHGVPDKDIGENYRNPPMGLWIKDNQWRFFSSWNSNRQSNNTTADGAYSKFLGEPKYGKWTEFVINFKVSYTGDGFVKVWMDGNQVISKNNIGNAFNDAKGPYLKFGIYQYEWKPAANNPPPADGKRLIYLDEMRIVKGSSTLAKMTPGCKSGVLMPKAPTNFRIN